MVMRDGGKKRDGTWKTTLNMESTKATDPARNGPERPIRSSDGLLCLDREDTLGQARGCATRGFPGTQCFKQTSVLVR
jgi:hypothetical protein